MGQRHLKPLEVSGQRGAQLFIIVNEQNAVHTEFSHCGNVRNGCQRTVPQNHPAQPGLRSAMELIKVVGRVQQSGQQAGRHIGPASHQAHGMAPIKPGPPHQGHQFIVWFLQPSEQLGAMGAQAFGQLVNRLHCKVHGALLRNRSKVSAVRCHPATAALHHVAHFLLLSRLQAVIKIAQRGNHSRAASLHSAGLFVEQGLRSR
ncbi:MAG: hypothetical protein KA752_12295, partial [Giesbergeria sp.]|nr:hypothetical protein [Giesbergeria sp.]